VFPENGKNSGIRGKHAAGRTFLRKRKLTSKKDETVELAAPVSCILYLRRGST